MEKSRACLSCAIFVNLSEDFIQITHNKVKIRQVKDVLMYMLEINLRYKDYVLTL